MRNKSKKILIMTLVITLILGGLSPISVVTAKTNQPELTLYISSVCPSSVLELELFTVTVKDQDNNPLPNATVIVDGYRSQETNRWGFTTFVAPLVDDDTIFVGYK